MLRISGGLANSVGGVLLSGNALEERVIKENKAGKRTKNLRKEIGVGMGI